MVKQKAGGYKIVLTADRTLMSEYNGGIFIGFSACMPRGLIPDKLYFSLFCPSVPVNKDGSVKYASCGIRKTEAKLLSNGFNRDDVIVAHPDHLGKVIGENTKVLGITETDPLGIGPATTTFTQLIGGDAYMKVKFKEILNNPAVQKYKPKIIIGGPGAWQLENGETRQSLGVDCVVMGECEKIIDSTFGNATKDLPIPGVVCGDVADEPDISIIQNPTIDGVVEIARGCGRGCAFCVPTLQKYRCLSIEHILKEVDVNLKAGRRPLLHAEDVLRYKANGFKVNTDAVKELFSTVYNHPGVESVGISHFALSSAVSAPELIEDLSSILEVGDGRGEWIGGQTGVETGSPRIIKQLMAGKAKPFDPEQWPEVVEKGFQLLNKYNWVPVSTLIVGLPTETDEDVQMTIDLVARLRQYKSLIVPLFMVSEGGLANKAQSFKVENITRKQSELFLNCWEHNLDWGEVFLNEYFVTKSKFGTGYGLKLVFNYTISQARHLLNDCKEKYDYNIPALIKDGRAGKYPLGPLPLRVLYKAVTFKPKILKRNREAAA